MHDPYADEVDNEIPEVEIESELEEPYVDGYFGQ